MTLKELEAAAARAAEWLDEHAACTCDDMEPGATKACGGCEATYDAVRVEKALYRMRMALDGVA